MINGSLNASNGVRLGKSEYGRIAGSNGLHLGVGKRFAANVLGTGESATAFRTEWREAPTGLAYTAAARTRSVLSPFDKDTRYSPENRLEQDMAQPTETMFGRPMQHITMALHTLPYRDCPNVM